jgi:quinol monooxygenase YgiN
MPQTNEIIFVTAELKIKTNIERAAAIEAIEQFCLDMQSEPGCLQAIATYDQNQSDRVILLEQYANREAINQHFLMSQSPLCGDDLFNIWWMSL